MFDVGFWELVIIAVVALLVIGPERLPGVARRLGLWVGRIRRFVANVRDDVERELRAEELRQAIERNASLDELKQIMNQTREDLTRPIEPESVVKAIDDQPAAADEQPQESDDGQAEARKP